jgi:transcriptional regulator with XRE-family HTH domain
MGVDVMQKETLHVRQAIGQNIREMRLRLRLTQEQLAEKTELSVQSMSALENGLHFAKMGTYCKIATVLAIPIHVLFREQRAGGDEADDEMLSLFNSCTKDTKKTLLNVVREITGHIRDIIN